MVAEAKNGDSLAAYILWRSGFYLGVGLSTLIQTLNPEMIAIGGSVTKAGKIYFDAMNESLKAYSWKNPLKKCRITKAKLGNDVADYGTLSLVLSNS